MSSDKSEPLRGRQGHLYVYIEKFEIELLDEKEDYNNERTEDIAYSRIEV